MIVGVLQGLLVFPALFVNAFQCDPVSKYWNVVDLSGSCINVGAYLAGAETVNSSIDFAMTGLGMFFIRHLQLRSGTKWMLRIVFAIGGL